VQVSNKYCGGGYRRTGTYDPAADNYVCTLCTVGKYKIGKNEALDCGDCGGCIAGEYNSDCGSLHAGTQFADTSFDRGPGTCTRCPVGYFKEGTGLETCIPCETCGPGYFRTGGASSSPLPPPPSTSTHPSLHHPHPPTSRTGCGGINGDVGMAGTIGAHGPYSSGGACTPCDRGYYKGWHGTSACTVCPADEYQSNQGGTACLKCPKDRT
jgi:hypothetical protein